MPRNVTDIFKQEKNKRENTPIYLYTIYDYDGSSDLHFAEYDSNVIYGGIEYQKFPITHEYISENIEGEIDSVKITVCNISRLIQAYLEQYNFRNKKVRILMVWANQLSDPDAYIEDIYYIDSYTADQKDVAFTLKSKFDVLEVTLPARKYSRNYCGWKFKSAECGYSGGETECNKTLTRCRELSNQTRFGGFPSIPQRRIVVG